MTKTVATVKIKLPFNQTLLDTMEQYSKSAQVVVDAGFDQEISNKRILHDTTYRTVRDLLDLPAQLVCSSRDKACEVLKAVFKNEGKKPAFKQFLAIRYDARSFNLKEDQVSLCSINGRIRMPIKIATYYKQYLNWDVDSADLIYDCKHRMFLHVVVSRDVDAGSVFCGNRKTVGVDVGVNPTAITSEKQFFHNKTFKTMNHYEHLRQILQKKGTKSAKRHLVKLSGREQRFKKDVNHVISKEIVEHLNPGDVIVMEDLTDIRKGKRGKRWKWLGRWSFRQLQDFIKYKAERKGCTALFVEPAYTSTRCSKCGSMNTKRVRGWFHCNDCGYSLNSHLNASFNIRSLGMSIATIGSSQPAYCSL
jgi:IS605 OrfB family transposase